MAEVAPVLHANGEHTQDWRVLGKDGEPTEPIPSGMQLGEPLSDPIEVAAAQLIMEKRDAPAEDPGRPLHWDHAVALVHARGREE